VQIVGGCVVVKGSRENLNVLTKLKKTDGETVGSTLTVEHLTKAIKNSIDKAGMPEEEARAMAQHVMNFFGYSERIIDNVLEPEDRDAFYMLEDAGILMTEREETTLYDGREWRIHYWMFRKERIHELISGRKGIDMGPGGADNVYDEIPDDLWTRE
jgi:polyhydroxyalkanoate synthesis regulator phasin